jgi:hypothetical protein
MGVEKGLLAENLDKCLFPAYKLCLTPLLLTSKQLKATHKCTTEMEQQRTEQQRTEQQRTGVFHFKKTSAFKSAGGLLAKYRK